LIRSSFGAQALSGPTDATEAFLSRASAALLLTVNADAILGGMDEFRTSVTAMLSEYAAAEGTQTALINDTVNQTVAKVVSVGVHVQRALSFVRDAVSRAEALHIALPALAFPPEPDSFLSGLSGWRNALASTEMHFTPSSSYIGPLVPGSSVCALVFAPVYTVGYCWAAALVVNALVMVPTLVIAGLFAPLHVTCAELDGPLRFLSAGQLTGASSAMLTSLLECSDDRPVFELGFGYFFDFEGDFVATQRARFAETVNLWNGSELTPLQNFSDEVDLQELLTPERMFGLPTLLPATARPAQAAFIAAAEGTNDMLGAVAADFHAVEAGSQLLVEAATKLGEAVAGLEARFLEDTPEVFGAGLQRLRCMEWRCAYQPLRDTFCGAVDEGLAWWVIAAMIFLVGLVFTMVSVCLKRLDMNPIRIEACDEDEEPNEELTRFAIGNLV
jgi:hypothetical protein